MTLNSSRTALLVLCVLLTGLPAAAQKRCFTRETRAQAERSAKVWHDPDPGYDPVVGYNPTTGARTGAPPADDNGLSLPLRCVANKDENPGSGTTPKFHCSVPGVIDKDGAPIRYKVKPHFKGQEKEKRNGEIYGEFLSSRFSQALGFFADDEWVADVTCPDCEKSLTRGFQGTRFSPFQPAAGIELSLGRGLDANCDGKDSGSLEDSLEKLTKGGAPRAEIDAFKLWLAFIDHGDTKANNHRYACLNSTKIGDRELTCDEPVFYVSDMGSTWGYSSASEKKARLENWLGKDPLRVKDGHCTANAKSIGDATISEAGRQLLAGGLQRLLDAEKSNQTITRVFRASRNQERDAAPEAWTAEFTRKANTIINARCSN